MSPSAVLLAVGSLAIRVPSIAKKYKINFHTVRRLFSFGAIRSCAHFLAHAYNKIRRAC